MNFQRAVRRDSTRRALPDRESEHVQEDPPHRERRALRGGAHLRAGGARPRGAHHRGRPGGLRAREGVGAGRHRPLRRAAGDVRLRDLPEAQEGRGAQVDPARHHQRRGDPGDLREAQDAQGPRRGLPPQALQPDRARRLPRRLHGAPRRRRGGAVAAESEEPAGDERRGGAGRARGGGRHRAARRRAAGRRRPPGARPRLPPRRRPHRPHPRPGWRTTSSCWTRRSRGSPDPARRRRRRPWPPRAARRAPSALDLDLGRVAGRRR